MPCPKSNPLTIINQKSQPHYTPGPCKRKTSLQTNSLSFNMRFAAAILMSFALLSSVYAQFPALGQFSQLPAVGGSDGPNCSNQNGLVNAAFLTHTNCYGSGAGTGSMSCGNQGGDPNGSGLLAGLLGSGNSLLNVNALSTVDCYN
ncbi:hypothetical protein KEM48_001037 [Puccinia striiformis f. sp. tritici PST-130]|uniref:Uncharacterized protein n=1 Tax=Puccinia striiformis f. sp. tritici PST-78 TaxID=1165861 RepID=A0A0L0V2J7_9BASI|nr:hypothetical protein Pst134EB_001698 [Puccinia striiformis f. sp. tritici]KAI9602086.1 hypothetical protein KEM48_001037 [Puccinia striiformis f. sp. tritici PST-130]KNE93411.1 hypothetical protein PSTG_13235 [Puccinia striiformis f. sp. tritici PST-78]